MHQRLLTRVRAVYIGLMAPLLGAAVFVAVFVSFMSPAATAATTSSNLNFQARILGANGTIVPDGNYNIDFKLYNADSTTGSVGTCSGACLWEETRKNFNSQGVQVINGYFSVNLGSVTSFPAINWDQQLWLTMNIGGTSVGASPTWDGEMQNAGHSIALTALPYSFVAGQLALTSGAHRGTLGFGSVTNDPAITLPNASGTVCLQAASACGFATGGGAAFLQGGNAFSATAVLGTTDSNGLNIVTGNNTQVTLGTNGAALFKNSADSAAAFQVQSNAGLNMFTANTLNGLIGIGAAPSVAPTNAYLQIANTTSVQQVTVAGSLTTSGNEITDTTRTTKTQGDGRSAPDSSYGAWEGTTNSFINGGFESNANDWASVSSSTLSRDTATGKFGSASLKVVTPGSVSNEGVLQNYLGANAVAASSGQTWTFSAWVKGSGTVIARIQGIDSGNSQVEFSDSSAASLSSGWQRLTITRTLNNANTVKVTARIITNSTQGITFWVDGGQMEQKPLATPYVETNGATASRSASRIQASSSYLNKTQGWAAYRLRMGWASSAAPNSFPSLLDAWQTGSTDKLTLYFNSSLSKLSLERDNGSATGASVSASWNAGDTITVVASWTSSQVSLSFNGANFTTISKAEIPTGTQALADLVSVGANNLIDSDVLWFASGSGTLTNTDASTINSLGSADPDITFFNSTDSSSSPSLIWKANSASFQDRLAFSVQNSTGVGLLNVDAADASVLLPNATSSSSALIIGRDADLYRSAAKTLKTDSNLIITGNLTDNGSAIFQNSTDSTTSFQVQNAAGNNYIQADTLGGNLYLGNGGIASNVQIGNTTGAVAQTINIGNNSTASSTNTLVLGSTIGSSATTLQAGSGGISLNGNTTVAANKSFTADGAATFQNATNSTTSFQVQNAAGTSALTVDTANAQVLVSSAGGSQYADEFNSGSSPAAKWTLTTGGGSPAPSASVGSGTLVLSNLGGANHDCWTGLNVTDNCTRLMEAGPSGDFQADIKINGSIPASANQAVGILAWQDNQNFIRFEYNGLGGFSAHSVISGTGHPGIIDGTTLGAVSPPAYLRVTRHNDVWTLGISTTGSNYTTVGSTTQALSLSQIGLEFIDNNSTSWASTAVDYFRLTTSALAVSGGVNIKSLDNEPLLSAQDGSNNNVLSLGEADGFWNLNLTGTETIASDGAKLFSVQTAAGVNVFNVDTLNGLVGTAATSTASTNSRNFALQTGNATGATSNSGNLSIDVGTATGTTGTISIGTANTSSLTIGNTSQSGPTTITAGSGGISLGANTTLASGKTLNLSNNSASGLVVNDSTSSKAVVTVDTSGDQLVLGKAGASGLTGKITFNNATNSNTVSIQAGTTTTGYTLTLPTALPGSSQCLQGDNSGTLSFTTCVTSAAVNTIGPYSSSNHYNDGASITGSTLTLGSADLTHPGLIDTSNQTFGGNKTFNGAVVVGAGSASITAFQVQDNTSVPLFNVNTTDGYVINNGTADLSGNLIQNPGFEASGTTEATGWYTPSGTQVITNSSANAHGGNYELQVTGNSSTHAVTTKYFAVHPGDTIYVEGYVKNSAGATGDAGIYVEYSDKDKGNASFTAMDTGLPGTSYILKSNILTIPAGKYYVRLAASVKATATAGTFYFDDFYLKRVNEQAPLLLTNVSATAFQVQNASAQTVLGVDTTNSKIFTTIPDSGSAIGFTFNTPSYTTSGAKLLSLQNNAAEKFFVDKDGNVTMSGGITAGGDISTTGNANIGSGKVYKINGTQITSAALSNNSDLAKLSGTGPQVFSGNNEFDGTVLNKVASATAFQVQNASNAVFTVDTSGNKVILGTASNITGKLQFQGSGGGGTLTLAGPITPDVGNFTLSIPAITANANVCTDNSICSGYASSTSLTTGLAGKLNKNSVDTSAASVTALQGNLYAFTNNSNNIASGLLKLDNGNNTGSALAVTGTNNYGGSDAYIIVNNTNGTPSGSLIDLQANAASKFNVDAAGNVTAAGNISIASGKLYEINGVQITSAALSDGNTLAKLGANQTFSGNNTFSSAANSFTGDGSGLTNLNATNVATGTLNDGRLSSNVALLNRTGQSFTGDNTFAPTTNNAGTTIKQTSGTATSGSVLDVQTANGSSHFLQITNAAANEGAVTLQSVGATRDLTLGSASGTLIITAATNTIQHSNTSLTIDVNNGADTTFTITNAQGGAVANLSVEGDAAVGAGRVFKVGATSGVGVTCGSNTFSQNQTTIGGIVSAVTCSNAVTSVTSSGSVANGASITGNALTLGFADTSNPGLVNNTTQSFNGAKTFTNDLIAKSNSATAFQVQNTSARSLLVVDTNTGNSVTVGNTTDGAQIVLGATGNATGTIEKTMVVNGTIAANDLVEIDTGNAGQVKQAAASSTKVFGVATTAVGSGASQNIVIGGIFQVNANASGGTINIGDTLVSSSTAGQATKSGTTTSSGSVVGLAVSTLSGGKVWVYINLGLGGSDNLQTVYNKDTGGTTPDIKVSSTVGGLDIQDADSPLNASLFAVRNSNSSGLGAAIIDVQSSNPITDITNNANNNLVTNGSLETGVTGWAKMGTTQVAVAQDTTQRYTGTSSLKIVTNATDTSGTDGANYNLTTSTLVSNTQYTLSLWAKLADGSSMGTFELGRAENGSTNTSCLTAQTVSGSGWTQYSCTFTTATTSGTPYVYVRQTDQVARTIYIDGIQLYRTSLLSNQFADQAFAAGDWQAKGGATVTRDTTQNQAGAGTASVKVATSAAASNNDGVKHNITLNDSTLYKLNFYALLDSGSTALTTMEAGYSSDGSTDNTVCITGQTVTTTWAQYSCSFTTPSSHSGTPFFYVKELNTTGVKTFYIDVVMLSIGNPLGNYSEGQVAINGTINSPVTLQNQTNSTTAFQLQNSAGTALFNANTLNMSITITGATIFGSNTYSSGSSTTITQSLIDSYTSINAAATAGSLTFTVPSPTVTTAGRLLYISNNGSNSFTISYGTGSFSLNVNSTVTLIWNGSAWTTAGADAGTLQTAYNNSTSSATIPEIKIDSSHGALDIQDADSTISGSLLNVRGSNGGGGGLGAVLFSVSSAGSVFQKSTTNSATAFQLQNNGGFNLLAADTSINHLKVFDGTATQSYVDIYYDDATTSAVIAASTGTTKIGNGTGDITLSAGASSAVTIQGHATSLWTLDSGNLTIDTTSASTPTLSIGTGAQVKNVTVGSTTGAAATTIQAGSGGITLTGATTVSGSNTFSTGTGAVSLKGDTTVSTGKELILGGNGSDLSCTNGAIFYRSDTNRFRGCENGAWIYIDNFADVQTYTSGDNTWTKPTNAAAVEVIVVGAGGGGGGGGARNGGQERNGGGGGGGGTYSAQIFAASDLASTAHAAVGAAGSSGAGAASSATAGSNGGAGGTSCFSSTANCGGTLYVEAFGGGGGGGGNQAGTAGGGGGGGAGVAAAGSTGSASSNTGATGGSPQGAAANTSAIAGSGAGGGTAASGTVNAGNPGGAAEYGGGGGGGAAGSNSASGNGGGSLHGAGGGGAGASTNSGNSTGSGGAGGTSQSYSNGGGGAAGTNGAACTAGNGNGATGGAGSSIKAGSGGGGGGANGGGGGVGCPGGNGGAAGGGGGGGGSGSGSAGAGGTGGAGEIWVISW